MIYFIYIYIYIYIYICVKKLNKTNGKMFDKKLIVSYIKETDVVCYQSTNLQRISRKSVLMHQNSAQ